MLKTLLNCNCFKLLFEQEESINYNVLQSIEKSDVNLDTSSSGRILRIYLSI